MTQEPGALSSSVIPILAVVAEDAVHDWGVAADRGDDDVAVDGLGDVGGFTAHGVAEVLDLDTFAAHNGDGGVAVFVGAPVADVSPLGHLAQSPVEVPEVYIGLFATENQVSCCQLSVAAFLLRSRISL